ncbi:DNA cytosine methyltransferase [Ottowia sp. GY511]|uniref:DNA (cytosine-5-)-methyltransferase n=1 Tax=Ottowia flava TaxID=2675430 RepID=A0ABW4KR97_9BURK|nr:DNA cytosine methyltransferase [Ottowia sp. GY511]TXK27732.1 DNA cytosine methyltransferase [Ottowia sp. GY511]
MNFISLCSGIEAASVAFGPLGWKAIAFSEIEGFPSAVLAHHYPTVRNYGDMSLLRDWPDELFADADAIVGGPPCQAFSCAGARRGLLDARGNLTLIYVELIDHADDIRRKYGKPPIVALYENVPGIFSDRTNAFGCLVGGLAGEDVPVVPPGKRWTDAGCVFGPERAVAWRLFDAQFFGLAQRRRRVFVVASARPGFDPAAVLFEWNGLRRDTAPSRETREVAPTIPARSTAGGGLGTDFDCDGGVVQVCPTLRAGGNRTGGDRPPGTDVDTADSLIVQTAHTLRGEGFDASEDGTGRGTPLVPVSPIPIDMRQASRPANVSNPKPGDPCHPLAAGAHAPAIAFDCKASGQNGFGVGDVASTMRAMGHAGSHQNGGGHQAVAQGMQVRRLTPEECEALQGFPRGYTAIPWRGKSADQCPDGPRYKALGNSWAVHCARWIGQRLERTYSTKPARRAFSLEQP